MEKQDAQPQPQLQANEEIEMGMTKKEALDILLKNVAESKAQIRKGQFYTHEQVWAMIEQRKNQV